MNHGGVQFDSKSRYVCNVLLVLSLNRCQRINSPLWILEAETRLTFYCFSPCHLIDLKNLQNYIRLKTRRFPSDQPCPLHHEPNTWTVIALRGGLTPGVTSPSSTSSIPSHDIPQIKASNYQF